MTSTLEREAIDLIRRGLPIVVCDGKVPLGGKEWHRKPVTENNLAGLLGQAKNPAIGLKLGAFVDIEADNAEEEELFAKLFDGCEPPLTPTYKSTRGKHRLFRSDERLAGLNKALVTFSNGSKHGLGCRIGGRGKAAQSVIPPSPGREWLVSWDDVEPAPLPELVVNRILAAANPQTPQRTGTTHARSSDIIDRAKKYLMRIPPAISGQGGHDATFHAACVLVQGFALERSQALELFRRWNELCQPPWSEAELEHKVDSAIADPAERGYLLNGSAGKSHSPAGRHDGGPRHTTDLGNAERFTAQHGANVRYCYPWESWLVWDGRRWRLDDSGVVMRLAKKTARTIYVEASKVEDKHHRESLAKWASASERRDRLAAMIALAQSEQPIPATVETWDSDLWLLNCENGTLDLRTGELRPHRRGDFLTKVCPVEYPTEDGSDPVLWLEFLNRIFADNAELIAFVRRLVGMALVGEVLENILPIFFGSGANGKSVLLETVCGVLGPDYAMAAASSLLMGDHTRRHPTELTDLFGRRLVAANETQDGGRLNEQMVKQLTSRENIRARRCNENFWEFRPSHTTILVTNHRPEVRGTDYGIWRRLRLVPFNVTIPEDERDPDLANKLKAEWPAILRWAVGGCLEWRHGGLQTPDVVTEATDTYQADMDVLGDFITERCIVSDKCEAQAGDLYASYKSWAETRGEKPESQKMFGMRLTERNFRRHHDRSGWHYQGIGVVSPGRDACDG